MRRVFNKDIEERERIKKQLARELADNPDTVFAYLYGSFTDGLPFHDVDIAVYLRKTEANLSFASFLAEQLGRKIGVPVDIRVVNQAPVSFCYHVLRGQLLTSQDEDVLCAFIEDTVRHYLDIAPLLRRSTKEAFA